MENKVSTYMELDTQANQQCHLDPHSDCRDIDDLGQTPLMHAAHWGSTEKIKMLIPRSNLNQRSYEDHTALMYAVMAKNPECCALLIKAGADINFKNFHGRTALMYAARFECAGMVELLIQSGADVTAVDEFSVDALGYKIPDVSTTQGRRDRKIIKRALADAGSHKGFRSIFKNSRILGSNYLDSYQDYKDMKQLVSPIQIVGALVLGVLLYFIPAITTALFIPLMLLKAFNVCRHCKDKHQQDDEFLKQPISAIDIDLFSIKCVARLLNLPRQASENLNPDRMDEGLNLTSNACIPHIIIAVLNSLVLYQAYPYVSDSWPAALIAGFLIQAIYGLFGVIRLQQIERQLNRRQKVRDQRADSIVEVCQANDIETLKNLPFCVYLRSFNTTAKLLNGNVEFETALASLISGRMSVIALGEPGEHIGAGRVTTDEASWKIMIAKMITNAHAILIIPSEQPGTLWEIDYLIKEKLLDKVTFIMHPKINIEGEKQEVRWKRLASILMERGLRIPPFIETGLIFKINDAGNIFEHAPFSSMELIDPDAPTHMNNGMGI